MLHSRGTNAEICFSFRDQFGHPGFWFRFFRQGMVGDQTEVTEMRLAVQSLEQAGGNDVLSITHAAMRSCGLTASEIASSIHKLADTNNPGCFTRSLVSVHHRKSTKLLFTTSLEPGHIPIAIEFTPDLVEGRHLAEPEAFVKFHRGLVG